MRYDLILDVAGSRRWADCKRVLGAEATYVWVGAPKEKKGVLGPAKRLVTTRLRGIGSGHTLRVLIAKPNRDDMLVLRDLIEAGKVTPVIDRTYELTDVGDAMASLGGWHARGKVVVTLYEARIGCARRWSGSGPSPSGVSGQF